jgi:hypothetical protein
LLDKGLRPLVRLQQIDSRRAKIPLLNDKQSKLLIEIQKASKLLKQKALEL